MSNLENLINQLSEHFDADAAGSMDEVFQFNFSDAEPHVVTIKEGHCAIEAGVNDDASATLEMSSETLTEILNNDLNEMQAFMTGKLKVSGNMMLATQLKKLFPM